jgi:2-keto-3-deoxy-L-rhamnonate aldolase RhmA
MRDNDVRRTLETGGSTVGLMVFEFGTPGVARMARAAGAEFVLYDMEHSGFSPETVKMLLDSGRAAGILPFARVRDPRRSSISQILDLGAMGIMVPMVESAEQAREIVSYARYAPEGTRGVAVYHADDLEPEGMAATLAKANREVLVIVQIETAAGVGQCEAIAAVPGVDVIWIGHFDLTTSLGAAWGSELHLAAVQRILAAAEAAGKPAGSLANDVAHARELLAEGYRAIAFGDVQVAGPAFTAAMAGART